MRPWSLLPTAIVLLHTGTMAQLGRHGKPVSPGESSEPAIGKREETAPETLKLKAEPTATTSNSRATTTTPSAVPLTTAFMPPDSCNEAQLTMLSSPANYVWLNEPIPVPGTTISDCYPPEFMKYYTTYHHDTTNVGSLVPLMSPLVCPFGWHGVMTGTAPFYQACCPVGFSLAVPTTALQVQSRPAYGGTCYSDWPQGSSAYVKVYGSASAEEGLSLVAPPTTGYQAYAHIIDGIVVSTSASTSSVGTSETSPSRASITGPGSPSSQASTNSASSGNSKDTSLSPGAIAGIVIGAVAGVVLIALGFFFLARRRRQQSPTEKLAAPEPSPPPPKEPATSPIAPSSTVGSPYLSPHPSDVTSMQTKQTDYTEMPTESPAREMAAESFTYELDGRPRTRS
ncbi:hypothetical protein F4808DRAFT_423793 [Astrocystis sublimbata]|nr:hypothetical protein F4808DRAFT_423793 [Astrocystis sublimbata]